MTPTIEIETRDGISVVHVAGEMRGTGDPALLDAVNPLLQCDAARVVLEMGQVPFMGSAALADLVRVAAEANTLGGRVVLANLTPFAKDLLATTKLDQFFEVHDDVDAASAALQ
jgi:anti-anti-sigma factor